MWKSGTGYYCEVIWQGRLNECEFSPLLYIGKHFASNLKWTAKKIITPVHMICFMFMWENWIYDFFPLLFKFEIHMKYFPFNPWKKEKKYERKEQYRYKTILN